MTHTMLLPARGTTAKDSFGGYRARPAGYHASPLPAKIKGIRYFPDCALCDSPQLRAAGVSESGHDGSTIVVRISNKNSEGPWPADARRGRIESWVPYDRGLLSRARHGNSPISEGPFSQQCTASLRRGETSPARAVADGNLPAKLMSSPPSHDTLPVPAARSLRITQVR